MRECSSMLDKRMVSIPVDVPEMSFQDKINLVAWAIMDSGMTGEMIREMIIEIGLSSQSEDEIEYFIDDVLAKNIDKVKQYRAGKVQLLGHFIGQTMKASKGRADPVKVNEIMKQKLENYEIDQPL